MIKFLKNFFHQKLMMILKIMSALLMNSRKKKKMLSSLITALKQLTLKKLLAVWENIMILTPISDLKSMY